MKAPLQPGLFGDFGRYFPGQASHPLVRGSDIQTLAIRILGAWAGPSGRRPVESRKPIQLWRL